MGRGAVTRTPWSLHRSLLSPVKNKSFISELCGITCSFSRTQDASVLSRSSVLIVFRPPFSILYIVLDMHATRPAGGAHGP